MVNDQRTAIRSEQHCGWTLTLEQGFGGHADGSWRARKNKGGEREFYGVSLTVLKGLINDYQDHFQALAAAAAEGVEVG